MPTPPPTVQALSVVLGAALILGGCGGEPPPVAAPPSTTAAPAANATPSEMPTTAEPTPSMEPAPTDPCEYAPPGVLTKALRKSLDGGTLIVDSDPQASYVGDGVVMCTLTLPVTHRLQGDGEEVDPELPGSLWMQRHQYDENLTLGFGDCEYGGSSAHDVYTSWLACQRADAATRSYNPVVTSKPSGKGGIATDGWNTALVAGPGAYWYEVTLASLRGSPTHVPVLEKAGRVLLQQEGEG